MERSNVEAIHDFLEDVIYLEDEAIEVILPLPVKFVEIFQLCGYKFYGSPHQPTNRNWAFNVRRGKPILEHWNKIPNGNYQSINYLID